jgi:F0F1-type ATP synthase assembly protein I
MIPFLHLFYQPPAEPACGYTVIVARPKKSFTALAAEYTSLAFLMPVSTFTGYAIGYLLDKAFGMRWLYIPFLILGSVAGFVQFIRQIMRDADDNQS